LSGPLLWDRNILDAAEFDEKLGYIHLNPAKRGLVKEPAEWQWSSFRHDSLREVGMVEIESEGTAHDREILASRGSPRVFLGPEPALSLSKG